MSKKPLNIRYENCSDEDLVQQVLDGNEDAMSYLLEVRYKSDIEYYTYECFTSSEYFKPIECVDTMTTEVFLHLRGKDGNWTRLRNFKWNSSFRTWVSAVMLNLFKTKYRKYTRFSTITTLIEDETKDGTEYGTFDHPNNQMRVTLLEGIAQLKDAEQRMILNKEIEGYDPNEIAEMLKQKRIAEGRVKVYNGKPTYPTPSYVYNMKAKAIKELKKYFIQGKECSYGCK